MTPRLVLLPLTLPRTSRPLPSCVDDAVRRFDEASAAYGRGAHLAAVDGFVDAADALRSCVPDEVALRTVCWADAVFALVDGGQDERAAAVVAGLPTTDPGCAAAVRDLVAGVVPGT
ncbi:hypothetical protein [Cellulomonas fimi]|uniref:Uncharacterized protein n=1 Tax=Cellulomonas fimi (strain ATCC 484 / DSM 20113 / JCM 1341 / CCUG 24087 / LMG 16345 / NBRC 15513 / NCIMB 8980 / NCTC 7547 / NRS-133) TaxID=590998 RepID=F4GZS8_CELFA|nr:hypothetical protein [Cellulomonas fimi]AEE47244.1 hypothetical protein Celf_3130 [Cellulomonas fimi ATCC 484]NNH06959.1 hypothetical protein [Cellulomonas fimi]VEH35702.1 Uncharacterised protein [Cellulomonas fimi]